MTDCSNKLIGARWFAAGFQAGAVMEPNDFLSPRDFDGHGTHTSTTAAGRITTAILNGRPVAKVGGMAPLAYLAIYKACYPDTGWRSGRELLLLRLRRGGRYRSGRRRRASLVFDRHPIRVRRSGGRRVPECRGREACSSRSPRATRARVPSRPRPASRGSRPVAASTQDGTAFAQATRSQFDQRRSLAITRSLEGGVHAAAVGSRAAERDDVAAADPIDACTRAARQARSARQD